MSSRSGGFLVLLFFFAFRSILFYQIKPIFLEYDILASRFKVAII